ncbi:hypothetical protein NM688_g5151 [Phlebia brevispora]|uniref:Uncharacterized protein n=1 Tax=Phlebia brevispora TaxID=194682 RepID=A0ACC1SZW8_9APHY|nr:hypothetical protein NM688_g5151 [Phlebia brevispora]
MQNGMDGVHIGSAAQIVPVIEDLIELIIESSPIRQALEEGLTQEKEFAKEVREAIAKENASWKARTESKDKASREQHNRTLQDLEYCGQLVATHYSPRFAPLGRDNDGRIYYALNAGPGEFEASLQLVRGKDSRIKIGRRRGPWTADDRRGLQKWSWFVAVWGRKPEGAKIPEEDEDEDEDDHEDAWWGFWQPEEILKLAEWISRKSDLREEPKEKDKTARADGHLQRAKPSANGKTKGNGSRGRTVSAMSSLTSLSSSRSARELSPLSDLSSDEEGGDDDEETADESNTQGPPNVQELRGLVKGLREYAEMLQWRAGRVMRDAREDSESPTN